MRATLSGVTERTSPPTNRCGELVSPTTGVVWSTASLWTSTITCWMTCPAIAAYRSSARLTCDACVLVRKKKKKTSFQSIAAYCMYVHRLRSLLQSNPIQYNTNQYNTTRYNAIWYSFIVCWRREVRLQARKWYFNIHEKNISRNSNMVFGIKTQKQHLTWIRTRHTHTHTRVHTHTHSHTHTHTDTHCKVLRARIAQLLRATFVRGVGGGVKQNRDVERLPISLLWTPPY